MKPHAISTAVVLACIAAACGGRTVVVTPRAPVSPAVLAQLRVDPGEGVRDLFWGIGGRQHAPSPDAIYTFKGKDEGGFSVSYDVVGPDGVEWSAKIGPEAQTEVVVSRVLWGLGYHQPPVYYLSSWRLDRGDGAPRVMSSARFRPKLPSLVRTDRVWSWADNPFSGTRELKGLLVIMLMLNSTDLKDSNNSLYEPKAPWDTASSWYVVRDLGAALGETGKMAPRRNWLGGFQRESFITRVTPTMVEFDYNGRHQGLLSMIGPEDVRWAASQMQRLTDAQWRDVFRAAGYAPSIADPYIRRIKEKMADAAALRVDRRERDHDTQD
ncbi:MAG: hypothetical protein ACRD3C_14770 [Vicinamibacterales bacterium]